MPLFAFSIRAFATSLGGLGLFLVALLDSSFLSLPELADLLLIYMVVEHKDRMVFYASMSTLGSLAGCFALYLITRTAGDAFMRRHFTEGHITRGFKLFQRYGLLALIIPAVLPPPTPFKIFVLLAGLAGVSTRDFALAIGFGRGARYFGEGLLAVWFGAEALEFIKQHSHAITIGTGALIAAGVAAFFVRKRLRRASP
ncbi:MAG TPA: VTT domain-containing protein [Vicinamibacterales bacterium]|jgi:membrane protein YqaA with SNARE-associated domain